MVTTRKPMTATEKELFKETIIREYKLKHQEQTKKQFADRVISRLKALIPVEIVIGIGAATLLVYLNGFKSLVNLLLFGIIWLTLISALAPFIVKPK